MRAGCGPQARNLRTLLYMYNGTKCPSFLSKEYWAWLYDPNDPKHYVKFKRMIETMMVGSFISVQVMR